MIHGSITYNLSAAPAMSPESANDDTREILSLDWQVSETASHNPELIAALGMRFMRSIIRTMPEDRREQVWKQAMLEMEALLAGCRAERTDVGALLAVSGIWTNAPPPEQPVAGHAERHRDRNDEADAGRAVLEVASHCLVVVAREPPDQAAVQSATGRAESGTDPLVQDQGWYRADDSRSWRIPGMYRI